MVARAQRAVQDAFSQAKDEQGFTQAELARKLDMDRSLLNRQLMGQANLTLRTLGEMAWALDRILVLQFLRPPTAATGNQVWPATDQDSHLPAG